MMELFKRNISIKAISVMFAFLMWIYVMAEVDPMVIRDFSGLNVEISNMEEIKDSGMTLSPDSKLDVRLILRGRRSLMKEVEKSQVHVHSTIEDPRTGKNAMMVEVDAPEGVSYTLIPDNRMTVELEEYVVEKKKINVVVNGKVSDNLRISDITVNPQYTYVDGPKSLIDKVHSLSCTLKVSEKSGSFNAKSNVVALDKNGVEVDGVGIRDKTVYVGVGIQKQKEVPVELVLDGKTDSDHGIKSEILEPSKVTISGSEEELEKIQSIKTVPVNIDGLAADKKMEVELVIPEKIFSETKKISLALDISKITRENLYISKERISFINNIQNLDISKNDIPDSVKLKVTYLEENKKKFNPDNIQIFINMQEPLDNPAKFKIECTPPEGVEILEIEPKNAIIGLER